MGFPLRTKHEGSPDVDSVRYVRHTADFKSLYGFYERVVLILLSIAHLCKSVYLCKNSSQFSQFVSDWLQINVRDPWRVNCMSFYATRRYIQK
jgi:hypothetical protein